LALVLTLDKVTGVDYPVAEALPTTVHLYQNYPNPFNPSTTIRYELPHESYVTLRVYDLLGQEVTMLVDGTQNAGYKSIEFNASGLPSGVYLYRLTAGNQVQTNKMTVLR
jgi:Secretion system C-terminal sorting domain